MLNLDLLSSISERTDEYNIIKAEDIRIPATISVIQWTPETILPITVITAIDIAKISIIAFIANFVSFLLTTIIDIIITVADNIVCDEGYDASKPSK